MNLNSVVRHVRLWLSSLSFSFFFPACVDPPPVAGENMTMTNFTWNGIGAVLNYTCDEGTLIPTNEVGADRLPRRRNSGRICFYFEVLDILCWSSTLFFIYLFRHRRHFYVSFLSDNKVTKHCGSYEGEGTATVQVGFIGLSLVPPLSFFNHLSLFLAARINERKERRERKCTKRDTK